MGNHNGNKKLSISLSRSLSVLALLMLSGHPVVGIPQPYTCKFCNTMCLDFRAYRKNHRKSCTKRVDCPTCGWASKKGSEHHCPPQCPVCHDYVCPDKWQVELDWHKNYCRQCPGCQRPFVAENGYTKCALCDSTRRRRRLPAMERLLAEINEAKQ